MGKFFFFIWFFALLFGESSLLAQSDTLRVDDFHFEPSYLIKARKASVLDGNNKPCALVVLRIAISDVKIEDSYVVKVEEEGNEYYIWIAENASSIIVKTPDYLPLEYHFPETIKSKSAYVMTVRKPESNIILKKNILSFFESALLPGLGQWEKGYAGYGILNMVGEAALIGGAIYFYNSAQKYYSEISSGGIVNAENVNRYNSSVTTFNIFIGGAVALYVFNLFQAVMIKPRNSGYVLVPTMMPFNDTFAAGFELTFNF